MADQLDRAQEINSLYLEVALRNTLPKNAVSQQFCTDCYEAIPEARRQAVPGCECCISCAEERER